jgi:hypothetical protein
MKRERQGWTWSNVGDYAMKMKLPLGRIACPHCGTLIVGVIEPICGFCEKPYWPASVAQSGEAPMQQLKAETATAVSKLWNAYETRDDKTVVICLKQLRHLISEETS